jgi:hypothetical protein
VKKNFLKGENVLQEKCENYVGFFYLLSYFDSKQLFDNLEAMPVAAYLLVGQPLPDRI